MAKRLDPTVLLTIGPFFPRVLAEADNHDLTRAGSVRGVPIVLAGRVRESGDQPVRNAVVEIWQPDADGLFAHPADPRAADADPNFLAWGRCATNADGWYRFRTVMPGPRSDNVAGTRLPHVNMMLLASGIMRRLTTTLFFGAGSDPVLSAVSPELRERLQARRAPELDDAGAQGYRFDVVLQGTGETPFFLD
ncbi:MAG TPA: protocatechuate 3,4-dioxygenase subunit alpha [Acetobacteraceae bacterium]|nr:protocatechuate 3,4-dioxygenase subunit alpha [Acetobacteraceae bacterium]